MPGPFGFDRSHQLPLAQRALEVCRGTAESTPQRRHELASGVSESSRAIRPPWPDLQKRQRESQNSQRSPSSQTNNPHSPVCPL